MSEGNGNPRIPQNQDPRIPPATRQFVERRKRKDWVTRLVSIISVVVWLVVAVMLLFIDRAMPQKASFFNYLFNVPVENSSFNTSLLRYALALLIAVFCICVVGFLMNMLRHRRKEDKYSKSIIIVGALSLLGIGLFVWQFGRFI